MAERFAATTICQQFAADGTLVGLSYDSLGALRWAVVNTNAGMTAKAWHVQLLVLTATTEAAAVTRLGLYEHGNGATVECTGTTLVIHVPVNDGDLAVATDKLIEAYNSVFDQCENVTRLGYASE